jgi:hypothetical protein
LWWHISITPATWEAEFRRFVVPGQSWAENVKPYLKNKVKKELEA